MTLCTMVRRWNLHENRMTSFKMADQISQKYHGTSSLRILVSHKLGTYIITQWQQQAPPHKYNLHGFARQALSFYMRLVSKRYWLFPAVTHHIDIPICTDIAFSVYIHTTVYSTYHEICTRFCCALHDFDISSLLSGGLGFINPYASGLLHWHCVVSLVPMKSAWTLPWYSLEMLKTSFSVSSECKGCHHDGLSVSVKDMGKTRCTYSEQNTTKSSNDNMVAVIDGTGG